MTQAPNSKDQKLSSSDMPTDSEVELISSKTRWTIFAGIIAVLLIAQLAMAGFAYFSFRKEMRQPLDEKAQVIGRTIGQQVKKATDLGIPFDKVVGMEEYLQGVLQSAPDIEFLVVRSNDTNSRYEAVTRSSEPRVEEEASALANDGNHVVTTTAFKMADGKQAFVDVGVHSSSLTALFQDVLWDVLAVFAVSLLVALELLIFFMAVQVNGAVWNINTILNRIRDGDFTLRPAGGRSGEVGDASQSVDLTVRRVNERFHDLELESQEIRASQIDKKLVARIDRAMNRVRKKFSFSEPGTEARLQQVDAARIRAPLFLFMFSEEMSRSFLPLLAGQLFERQNTFQISSEIALGIPITLFMLVVAIVTPGAGTLTDRYGPRRIFVVGALLAVIGYALTIFTGSYLGFLAARAVSAVGYGLVFISAQGYISASGSGAGKARDMSIFVLAVLIAGICGPAIGGLLADRVGYQLTFAVSVILGLISAYMAFRVLEKRRATDTELASKALGFAGYMRLFADRHFASVTMLIAVPTKVILAGVIFYLVPVYLFSLENSQSAIGRIMMVYGIAVVLLTPIFARYADKTGTHRELVAGGGLITMLACLLGLLVESTPMILFAIGCVGIAHAMSIAPQLALVQEVGEQRNLGKASTMSGFRLLERLGTVMDPLLVGLLLTHFDYKTTMAIVGVLVGASAAAYYLLSLIGGSTREGGQRGKENLDGHLAHEGGNG